MSYMMFFSLQIIEKWKKNVMAIQPNTHSGLTLVSFFAVQRISKNAK